MGFKKTMVSGKIEPMNPTLSRNFNRGARYIYNNQRYIVLGVVDVDGIDSRKVVDESGNEEIISLKDLQKELDAGVILKESLSQDVVAVKADKTFKVGSKYILGGTIYRISEAFDSDNTSMRRVVDDVGNQELFTLNSLQEDLALGLIKWIN